jgi:alkylated DNA repair protein alkB family protein 8
MIGDDLIMKRSLSLTQIDAMGLPYYTDKAIVDRQELLPIDGLYYFPNFLNEEEQKELLEIIDSRPFCSVIHRRQQFYGDVYYHTTHDVTSLQPEDPYALKSKEAPNSESELRKKEDESDSVSTEHSSTQSYDMSCMTWLVDKMMQAPYNEIPIFTKEKYPTQFLVNEYLETHGIATHYDDENAFGDTIVTVSLVNPIPLRLQYPTHKINHCKGVEKEVKILLEPGSLFVMKREARCRWRHGITRARWVTDFRTGERIIKRTWDYRRVSVTIRELLDGRKKVIEDTSDHVEVDSCHCVKPQQ